MDYNAHPSAVERGPLVSAQRSRPGDRTSGDRSARWWRQGRDHMNKGRYRSAVRALQRALEAVPDHPGIRLDLGEAYLALGAYRRALEQFDRVLQHDPDSVRAWTGRGTALLRGGRIGAAIRALQEAVQRAPADREACLSLALAYLVAGDAPRAQAGRGHVRHHGTSVRG